jgi:pimeloyl-ACP methyl ester carboxylesterase
VLHVDLAACDVWTSGADAAKRIKCPALIVAGAKDIMTSSKGSAQLAELIDGSRSVTLANCGHMVMAEAPDELLDLLIEFFGQAKAAA